MTVPMDLFLHELSLFEKLHGKKIHLIITISLIHTLFHLHRLLSSFLDTPEHYHRRFGGRIKTKLLVNVQNICNQITNRGKI